MKKIIIICLCLVFVLSVNAQETASSTPGPVSKSGVPFLPAAGDFAIGADALPYLNYIGNIFNNTANNTLNLGSQSLYFRYHISDNSAIRAIIMVNKKLDIQRQYVRDDAAIFADPLSMAKIEDKYSISTNGYGINLAFQKSRGYGKLRGIYGVSVNYSYNRVIQNFAYGNNLSITNPNPTSTNWIGNVFGTSRILEIDGGIAQSVGAGILAGVEYYFLPKICIGGEVALNYTYTWGSQSNSTIEYLNGSQVETMDRLNMPGDKHHSFSTIRPANYGGLYLLFHF